MCIWRHSPLILFNNDDLETMVSSEENVQKLAKNLNISQVVGSTAGVAGGVATIVGFALAPFTFGTSIALTAIGLTLSLSGATVSIGATVVNINGKKAIRRNLDIIFLKYLRLGKSMGKLVQLYVQLSDILAQLPRFQNTMELTEAMGDKIGSLNKIKHDVSVLQVAFEPLPDKVENLLAIMENLSKVAVDVLEQMHNNPDNRDEVIQTFAPVTVKEAVDRIARYHEQQSTLLSDFILRFFWYTDANDGTTAHPTEMDITMDSGSGLLIPRAKYAIILDTMRIAMDLADDVFLTAAESLKVISKIGIVIAAIGIFIDVGVLTKSLIDLSNGSKEPLSVRFRNWRLHMELINSIPGIQRRNQ
ncbi:hypothetical protein BSL78_25426 [Apostichopus japonicus]|uniref:Uncharacterized protein n=1 Tax=Stichopus japonicus TaxID=307972 RepID=A0A2G8JPW2_STIJA|nr:hypothetical protein BSL78_25426 [Apostichopus japonicus]